MKEGKAINIAGNPESVTPWEEDATELITMCLWHKGYLHSYIKFLTDPKIVEARDIRKIRTLTDQEGRRLEQLIVSITKKILPNPVTNVE